MSSSRLEKVSEAVKLRAFETLVQAWDSLEDARMLQAQRRWEPALEALGQSLRVAGQSLAILYSASPEATLQLGLLRHLINTDRHFQRCSWTELETFCNRDSSALAKDTTAAIDPDRANRVVRTFLEATEAYHFSLKRRLYFTYQDHQRGRKRRILLSTAIGGGICLVLTGLYGRYSFLEPTRAYVTHGQAFWTSPEESEEIASNSMPFVVEGDGTFREYTLSLEAPVTMDTLRLDPVREANAEVWIDRIEIYRRGQTSPLVLRFDQPDHAWKANEDIWPLSVEDGTLHFRTQGNDPILRFPELSQDRVEAIKIRMRAWFRPSFLEWLVEWLYPTGGV